MALFPQINCHRCHKTYSSLHGRCPYCGARKVQPSGRAATPTSATQPGTEGRARAKTNNQMQTFIGLGLLALIIILVIVLVSVGLHSHSNPPAPSPTPTISLAPSPSPSPSPTPTPSPTPSIGNVKIQYLGKDKTDFTTSVGGTTQLKVVFYPIDAQVTPEWKSADESIATVDQNGLVTGVSPGKTTITVTVGGVKSPECIVRVK